MNKEKILNISKVELSNITCLHVEPNFIEGELPTVIYYHGWGSNKDNQVFLAKTIAKEGYRVILPDAPKHGERGKLDFDKFDTMKNNFLKIVIEAVEESKDLICDIISKLNIDSEKIAIMGHSMGGFISSGVFAMNKNIKCLINLNGSAAWEYSAKLFEGYYKKLFATEDEIDNIKKLDPVRHKEGLYPRPILLVHGNKDSQVPIDIQKYFMNEIKPVYKDKPERLHMIEYPELNHYKTIGMIEESIKWLDKYL
ncbi:alpha/beta fold hydrolase [Clostridium sp. D2Q-14]|uniref:alpha/beta hydrolase family protein n=1 Tax=Anaeromonas gelatinilytica TaxID=2683194 RepID=UPI00193B07B8|nr:alpha/beta fold hydrolase [Anaeromonas gelatinilytica]MBS4536144.1 alpha/beta fold hydrolase [Anaeromonas gelatinilytica]